MMSSIRCLAACAAFSVTASAALSPPIPSKAFTPSTIVTGQIAILSFQIVNPNPTQALSNLTLHDTLPAGLVVATPNGLSGSCGGGMLSAGIGGNTVNLSGGTLASNSSCAYSVHVTTASPPVFGVLTNTTDVISSNETGTGGTASAILTVNPAQQPTLIKAFTPSTIVTGQITFLSFQIMNPNPAALTNLSLSDTLPAGLIVATPNGLSGSCGGGMISAGIGGNTIKLSDATLSANSSCAYSVHVTTASPPVFGALVNTTAPIFSDETGTGSTASATLTVNQPQQPTVIKAFTPSTIIPGQTTSLSFQIMNPNPAALTSLSLSDTLPAGMVVATPNGLSGSCGGGMISAAPGSNTVNLAAATLPANSSCAYSVHVTTASPPVFGLLTNTTAAIFTTETGTGGTASATLTVVRPPPTITKAFGTATVPVNGTTSLSFTIMNPNTTAALSGIGFTDTLPGGLIVATPNGLTGSCGGGLITATAGSNSVSLSNAALAASGSCTFAVNITGIAAGAQNNTTGPISSNESGQGGTSNTASLTVVAPPAITKAFGALAVALNGSTSLTFNITNPNTTVALVGVGFSDPLPGGLVVSTPNGLTNTCGGAATATAGSSSITLVGGTVAASASCTLTVNVTGTTPGAKNNTTTNVTSSNGGTGNTASASLAVLAPPTITKSFADAEVQLFSGSTAVSFTLSNPPANTLALTGVGFTDILPAGLLVQVPANGLVGTCGGGTITAVPGSNSISLSGATLPVNGSCTFSVVVQGANIGVWVNTTFPVTSTNGGTGLAASATTSVDDLFFIWFFE
jgi:hypothetical protein